MRMMTYDKRVLQKERRTTDKDDNEQGKLDAMKTLVDYEDGL